MTEIDRTKEKFKCSRCRSDFYHKDFGLTRLEERYKTCIKCRKTRKVTRANLKLVYIKEEKFKCDTCSKCFGTNEQLNAHIKGVHLQIKDFKCDTCLKCFGTNGEIQRHIKAVHLKIKDYCCEYDKNTCTQSFSFKSKLKRHIEDVHLNIKNFKCDYKDCSHTSSHKTDLQKHVDQVHLKIKNFFCKDCDDFLSYAKSELTRHQTFNCHKGDDSERGSAGEKFIKRIFKKLGIPYLFDEPFDNLISIKGVKPVQFDFILYSDTDVPFFIEYDGEQHFKKNWFGRDGKFETLQANDKIKDDYCEKNFFPMLRIKYDTPFDNIEDIIKDFIY